MPQSLANLYVHLIFSTKERYPFLTKEVRPDLHAYMAAVLAGLNSPAVRINSVADHVKKSSSKWIKTQGAPFSKFAWQAGYGGFSVSESNAPKVADYIRNQEEHHRKKSFQEEYREFLAKHKIQYDERYVWD